jgi:1,4-alpha-glucan branching enzyme
MRPGGRRARGVQSLFDGAGESRRGSPLSRTRATPGGLGRDLTNTLRFIKSRLLQNAEFWPGEVGNYPKSTPEIVTPVSSGGAGFDVVQYDGLRGAIRNAVGSSAAGQHAGIDFDSIARTLYPQGFSHAWQTVTCIENHDIVKVGADQRIPYLSDSSDRRSWYARSRTRFAMGILLMAPGIPQLFMGQEFLEDKRWSWDAKSPNLVWWDGLNTGADPAMVNHLRFTQDLVRLRWNHPALREDNVNPFHVHNLNRVIAFHRWIEGTGQDVVVVATLAESTWYDYAVGFPSPGRWTEVFNSDVYDNWVNPIVAGNGGGIVASNASMQLKAVARARVWFDELASGRVHSLARIARNEAIGKR